MPLPESLKRLGRVSPESFAESPKAGCPTLAHVIANGVDLFRPPDTDHFLSERGILESRPKAECDLATALLVEPVPGMSSSFAQTPVVGVEYAVVRRGRCGPSTESHHGKGDSYGESDRVLRT